MSRCTMIHESVYTAIVISLAGCTEFENIYIGLLFRKNMELALDDSRANVYSMTWQIAYPFWDVFTVASRTVDHDH